MLNVYDVNETFSFETEASVGIDLKELGGGQLPKYLKFYPGI